MTSVETAPSTEPTARRRETAILIERLIGVTLVALVLAGTFLVLRPFLTAFLFGGILVVATWPLHDWMLRRGLPVALTAVILTGLSAACIVLPIFALAPAMGGWVADLLTHAKAVLSPETTLPVWLVSVPLIGPRTQQIWSTLLEGRVQELLQPYSDWLRTVALNLGSTLAQGAIQVILSLIVAATLWIRGEAIRDIVLDVGQRFGGQLAKNALQLTAASIRAVSYGIVGTAVVQAMLLTFGMWICGIPRAGLLGFVTLVIALSQLGILLILIWGGCAWWLYSNGAVDWAIFMLVWGLIVSVIDNIIRPLLVGVSVAMPFTLIFFGVFGGFIAFGFLGMFIGPTLLSVFLALLQAWRTSAPA
jgi:predicted PurR-regulated permease PerM